MNISKIRAIEQEYQNCDKCSLCKNRKNYPHFGMGHPEGSILIVIPEPYIGAHNEVKNKKLYDNAPIQATHRLYKSFNALLKKAMISKLDTYIIPAVMCPISYEQRPQKEEVVACNTRLRKTISAFNPKILVLCGPVSYFSWFNKLPADIKYGELYNKNDKIIYYTRNVNNFLDIKYSKKYNDEDVDTLAYELLDDWIKISSLLKL